MSGYDTDLHLGTGTNIPYLTYGYDEFGNDLYDLHDLNNDLEDTGIPNPYSRQGEDQPFGYTGYRHDEIGGTYFAQAREYQPQNGRFTAEDVLKGNGAYPETLNNYGYCWGNPVGLVDLDGMTPEKNAETAYVYYIDDFEREANWQIKKLKEQGLNVTSYNLTDADSVEKIEAGKQRGQYFMEKWNGMDDSEQINSVYIFSHGSERMLLFEEDSRYDALTINGKNSRNEEVAGKLDDLNRKNISNLYIQACNTGVVALVEVGNKNAATILSTKTADNGVTYAWDGSVSFGPSKSVQHIYDWLNKEYDLDARSSWKQGHYEDLIHQINRDYDTEFRFVPLGQVEYVGGEYVGCD